VEDERLEGRKKKLSDSCFGKEGRRKLRENLPGFSPKCPYTESKSPLERRGKFTCVVGT